MLLNNFKDYTDEILKQVQYAFFKNKQHYILNESSLSFFMIGSFFISLFKLQSFKLARC